MPKQVPEDKKKLSEEEQLAKLRAELMGNKVFGGQRGRWTGDFSDVLQQFFAEAKSPTAAVKRFDEFAGNVRVMIQKLAKLRRDGEDAAFNALKNALQHDSYVIRGETFPLEKTRPVTLVMFDPEKTFYVQKLTGMKSWIKLFKARLLTDPGLTVEELFGQDKPVAEKFASLFPHWREDAVWRTQFVWSLSNIFWEQIRRELDFDKRIVAHPSDDWFEPEPVVKHGEMIKGKWLWYEFGRYNNIPLCLRYYGRPADLLRLFTREEQKLLRTWSFDCPVVAEPEWFGLHPEAHHVEWQKREPAFMSKNVSEGRGAAILYDDLTADYFDRERKNMLVIREMPGYLY